MIVISRRDLLLVFTFSAIGILGGYLTSFGMMGPHLVVALGSYSLLLFFVATLLLRSIRKAFYTVYTALVSVATLSFFHMLLFPGYDSVVHLSYFVVLLLSYLLNLYVSYSYSGDVPLFRLYRERKPIIASAVVSTMLVSLLVASQEVLYYFGILSLVGSAIAYLALVFLFLPLLRIERYASRIEKPTEDELRVRKFVEKYGKSRDVYPFYATWMGTAVSSIEDMIDALEAKGYLGHNFFAVHNPFYWFSLLLSFLLGVKSAGGSFLHSLSLALLIMIGIAMVGPQAFLERRVRRLLGTLFLLTGLVVIYLESLVAFRVAVASTLLAIVSIYFAYRDDEIVSAVFASFFVGSFYLVGYGLFKPVYIHTPLPWFVTFVVFSVLVYDLYVRGQSS